MWTWIKRFNRTQKFSTESQDVVYARALDLMKDTEVRFLDDVKVGAGKANHEVLFKIRLFAINFCVHALTHGLGEVGKAKAEEVYLALLKRAAEGLRLSNDQVRNISIEQLREQDRALSAEKKNVGSGQYALALLYGACLEQSGVDIHKLSSSRNKALDSILGQIVGEYLAVWSELYQTIAKTPMQVYTEGFVPTEKDSRGFRTD